MPTYDYECSECGHTSEVFQSIAEKPLRKCPACGRKTLRRLIGTGGGIIFKGTGFYATDYRSDSYKSKVKEESGASDSEKTSTGEAKDKKGSKEKSQKNGKK